MCFFFIKKRRDEANNFLECFFFFFTNRPRTGYWKRSCFIFYCYGRTIRHSLGFDLILKDFSWKDYWIFKYYYLNKHHYLVSSTQSHLVSKIYKHFTVQKLEKTIFNYEYLLKVVFVVVIIMRSSYMFILGTLKVLYKTFWKSENIKFHMKIPKNHNLIPRVFKEKFNHWKTVFAIFYNRIKFFEEKYLTLKSRWIKCQTAT